MTLNDKIENFRFDMTPATAREIFRELRDYPQVRSQVRPHTKALALKVLIEGGFVSHKAHLEQVFNADS